MPEEFCDLRTLPKSENIPDPTYGYDLAKLKTIRPPDDEPADFADFWRNTFEENRRRHADVHPTAKACSGSLAGWQDHDLFEITFDSWGDIRLHGWLALPKNRLVKHRLVIGHGYGGREAPDALPLLNDAAILFPCFRGLGRSNLANLSSNPLRHVIHGLESKESYVHRFCACDLWNAATAISQWVPQPGGPLAYVGDSFGGGIGALALPWDDRFAVASLGVPSFGHHPLRLTMPCTGSGEAVRVYHRHRPQVTRVLAYFDAATAAKYLGIPVQFRCALFDPSVPPPGQFAVHNAARSAKELVLLQAGHTDWPGLADQQQRQDHAKVAWLTRWLA